jgi:hypothetical protein
MEHADGARGWSTRMEHADGARGWSTRMEHADGARGWAGPLTEIIARRMLRLRITSRRPAEHRDRGKRECGWRQR